MPCQCGFAIAIAIAVSETTQTDKSTTGHRGLQYLSYIQVGNDSAKTKRGYFPYSWNLTVCQAVWPSRNIEWDI